MADDSKVCTVIGVGLLGLLLLFFRRGSKLLPAKSEPAKPQQPKTLSFRMDDKGIWTSNETLVTVPQIIEICRNLNVSIVELKIVGTAISGEVQEAIKELKAAGLQVFQPLDTF